MPIKPKGKLINRLATGIFLLIVGCAARAPILEVHPPDLINQAEQDLIQAKIEANRQKSAIPETMAAEEQLKKAKEMENRRSAVVAGNAAASPARKATANEVILAARVSSIHSKIAMIKAKEADLTEQNSNLELELARLQAEATAQWSEINKVQMELGVSSRAELEKKLEEERQARLEIKERLESSQKTREEAARKLEAGKLTDIAEMKRFAQFEDFRRQQAEIIQKLNSLEQEFIRIKEEPRGIVVTLSSAFFAVDKFTLQPDSAGKLNVFAQLLKDYPDRRILAEGHTDNRDSAGNSEHNQILSEKRADAVKDCLVNSGINPDKIEIKGYGDKLPAAANDTAEGRQLNRRVDIVIVNPPNLL